MSGGPTAADALASSSARSAAAASAAPAPAGAAVQPSVQAAAAPSFLPAYQDPQPAAAPNGFGTILGLAIKLAIVVGLIYATVVGLRYFGNRTRRAVLGDSSINVLE